jgi:hypothetical protein
MMRKRPKPRFLKVHRKEDPIDKDRDRLISVFKAGGCDIEAENIADIGIKNRITYLDARVWRSENDVRELSYWVYVGDLWWCRYIECDDRYEFARYVAYVNDDKCNEVVGLWREALYGFRAPPVIVYYGGRKGQISAYSEFEIIVQWWEDGVLLPGQVFSNPGDLVFEFEEDHQYYSGIIANIKR